MLGGSRPRILRVITRLNIGGPSHQALLLNQGLTDYGFQSRLITGSVGHEEGEIRPPADLDWLYVRDLRRGLNPLADTRAAVQLGKQIRMWKPTIVHTHHSKAGALGRLAAKRGKVPVIVHTFHGHVLKGHFSRAVTGAFVKAERKLARISTALIAVSAEVRDELLDLGVGRPSQWRLIPLGLELRPFLNEALSVPEARMRLGLPLEGPLIGIVGRLTPIKDHDTFLTACAHLASTCPGAKFVVAGDGELRDALKLKAERLQLQDRVIFLGWVHDLSSLYRSLDVVVLTSKNEGTPVALIEAAAAARPIVATRVGGVPAVVSDGQTGLLAPPGDAEAISQKIMFMLKNQESANHLAAVGQAFVQERFSATRLTRDIAELYWELLEKIEVKD